MTTPSSTSTTTVFTTLTSKLCRTWTEIETAMNLLLAQLDYNATYDATPRVVSFRADYVSGHVIKCDIVELLAYQTDVVYILFIRDALVHGGIPPASLLRTIACFLRNSAITKVGFNIMQNIMRLLRTITPASPDVFYGMEKTKSALCLTSMANATALSSFAGSSGAKSLIDYSSRFVNPKYPMDPIRCPIEEIRATKCGWSTFLLEVKPELFQRMVFFVMKNAAGALDVWKGFAYATMPVHMPEHRVDNIPLSEVKDAIMASLNETKTKSSYPNALVRRTKSRLTNCDIDLTRAHIMKAVSQLESERKISKQQVVGGKIVYQICDGTN
jgi:hypothetical protein